MVEGAVVQPPTLGGRIENAVHRLEAFDVGEDGPRMVGRFRRALAQLELVHKGGAPARGVHIVCGLEIPEGGRDGHAILVEFHRLDAALLVQLGPIFRRRPHHEMVHFFPVQMALTVKGHVRRNELLEAGGIERLPFAVVGETDGVLEPAGRGHVIDDAVGMAQVSNLGHPVTLGQHEGPNGTLGEQGFPEGKTGVSSRFEKENIKALFGQDARENGPIESTARDAHIEGGKLLVKHDSKMRIPCPERE